MAKLRLAVGFERIVFPEHIEPEYRNSTLQVCYAFEYNPDGLFINESLTVDGAELPPVARRYALSIIRKRHPDIPIIPYDLPAWRH